MQKQLENIMVDDAILVRRCRDGDSIAVERLIIKYQDRIFNVILRICGNKDDAAELTQETFVKFIENIGSFAGRSAIYTWLYRIGVNLTLNYCKRRAKLPMLSLDAAARAEAGEGATRLKAFFADKDGLDPAVVAQDREIGEIVMQSLGKLDDDHRAVLVLRDIEGMAYAEIADTLDVRLGTVKSRLSRARGNLKEILDMVL
ncbi:MAG: RNA polymerase subunit sigma-24 [Planctomycetota bacterium]|nr:MAG: RNA polymerase subunit sigma-24 [Planctomycetota bacterium]